ncbi:hypothetical protein AKJ38_01980 [candidate division MSBL1 archaeon SCGC-AAA259I14]|uniref:Uncharacterized protein n=2 Tax=candidate division MSBL1 TaxID=215777 RepID=A0A133US73_9EURY|nr:hypothetical protein AKJ36_01955 [candidate division MSBL1 archaeon SCGC-AAA259I07]KXA97094.1 hypothetical protein AKJ38_01980 [candidate division MSBL1 archaeon SCGC-AAA259I14]
MRRLSGLEQYESLNQILSVNEGLKETLIHEGWTDDQPLMSELDELFGELSECKGLEKKVPNPSSESHRYRSEIHQFRSFLSELRFARIFKNKGKSVKFLTEGYMGKRESGNDRKSPDMLIKNEKDAYIEVKRLKDLRFTIQEKIWKEVKEFLKKRETNYQIKVDISEGLSPPVSASVFESEEIHKMEKLWEKSLEEFKDKFSKLDISQISTISTEGATFEIQRTSNRESKLTLVPNASFMGGEPHKKKIKESLIEKAKKRYDWEENHRNKLYLIAIHLEGHSYGKFWREFIKDMYQSEEVHETEEKYVSGDCKKIKEIMRNVSGVLVLSSTLEFYVVRNSYAEDKINDPNLESYFE